MAVFRIVAYPAVLKSLNQVLGSKDTFLPVLRANIEMVIGKNTNSEITTIDKKLKELQKELLKRANLKMDYEDIADEIDVLREEKQNVRAEKAEQESVKQRILDMITFFSEQPSEIEEYDENLVRRLIQKVMIYEDRYTVKFKLKNKRLKPHFVS